MEDICISVKKHWLTLFTLWWTLGHNLTCHQLNGIPFLREEHKVFTMFSQSPLNGSRTLDWIYNSAYSLQYPSDGAIL